MDFTDISKISVFEFYGCIGNIENIDRDFNKNINWIKIVQDSCKCLKKLSKSDKIRNNTYIKVIL